MVSIYAIYYVIFVVVIYSISGIGLISSQIAYWLYTIAIILFSISVIRAEYHKKGAKGLLSLTSLYFIFQFLIQTGIGNFSILYEVKHFSAGWDYLCKAMLVSSISCIFFYFGTCSKSVKNWGKLLHIKLLSKMDKRKTLNKPVAIIGMIVVIPTYIVALRLGIVGYSDATTVNTYSVYANFSSYIVYITNYIPFVIFLFWTDYFVRREKFSRSSQIGCILITGVYLVSSFLTGMKADSICFAVAIFIIFLCSNKRIPLIYTIVLIVVVYIAFAYLPNFREILRMDSYSGNRMSALLDAFSMNTNSYGSSAFGDLLSRINLSQAASAVIKYKDEVGLNSGSPTFLNDLLLSPITCFIPRSLLPGKSMSTYGIWVYQVVYGGSTAVSSAAYVTVHGFMYLAGGIIGVAIFSYLISLLLTFYTSFISSDDDNIYSICIILMIGIKIIFEPATPIDLITSVTRSIIIYLVYSKILLKYTN